MDTLTQKTISSLPSKKASGCWNESPRSTTGGFKHHLRQLAGKSKPTLLWKATGLRKDDRIAINARGSSNWAKIFFPPQVGGSCRCRYSRIHPRRHRQHGQPFGDQGALHRKSRFSRAYRPHDGIPGVIGVIEIKTGELLASHGGFAEICRGASSSSSARRTRRTPPGGHPLSRPALDSLAAIMYLRLRRNPGA